LLADWPHKSETKSSFPPKGYAFLIFQHEHSVQNLIKSCFRSDNKYYTYVCSQTFKDKVVQIRPWCVEDADFVMNLEEPLDPRRTIFVGGVPRPLKAGWFSWLGFKIEK
jgi:cytoplasmic polyadenylation element-binding protein